MGLHHRGIVSLRSCRGYSGSLKPLKPQTLKALKLNPKPWLGGVSGSPRPCQSRVRDEVAASKKGG